MDVAAPDSSAKIDDAKNVTVKIRRILIFTTSCGQNSCAPGGLASRIANFRSKKVENLSRF